MRATCIALWHGAGTGSDRERIEAAEEAAGRRAQPFEAWIASGCAESQGGGDASACEAR
jgi:hypothetical protein